jgi:hypothetical protein
MRQSEISAVTVLVLAALEAYVATCAVKPRQRGRAFLAALGQALIERESVSALFPQRPAGEHEAEAKAAREALALFRANVRRFVDRLPPE